MKLVCMPVTITDWCSLHCYLPLQQVPSKKTYKKHQNVISGQKLRLLLIRGFKESPLLKQRQFRRDRKGRRERKGGKIAVIASQVKMTSFYCSYFVKGRIFSPLSSTVLILKTQLQIRCIYSFLPFLLPTFALIRSHTKSCFNKFSQRKQFGVGGFGNQRKLCTQKSQWYIQHTHVINMSRFLSRSFVNRQMQNFLGQKKAMGHGSLGKCQSKRRECNFQVEITSQMQAVVTLQSQNKQVFAFFWGVIFGNIKSFVGMTECSSSLTIALYQ